MHRTEFSMDRKRWIVAIMILTLFLLSGCHQISASPTPIETPDYLPVSEQDVREIKVWGTENGFWRDGRILGQEEAATILGWVNHAESLGTVNLPPEMAAPLAEIIIYLRNEKTIQLFLWHDDVVINYADSIKNYKIEQQDLENYLRQRIK